ncbi:uncharacterized protein LOC126743597 [Anthonomus grandis grandis]|uniref:uncharacterized protein LOC126743597 n=1 Tax=Anthonomus grandis grandis TaxID=2921223 RepID=UPI0021665617|nr:uncharacterized protein LOC126743597 [Anthonomus grandis grandis]XP_050306720.1 uncharacterized protein LOC126743597 [Anthonomus grandis grandis]
MTDTNKGIQVTEQGVGSPVPVGDGGARAGPPRPSANNRQVSGVGDQARILSKDTGINTDKGQTAEMKNKFLTAVFLQRRNSISEGCEQAKRKRLELSMEEEKSPYKQRESPEAFVVNDALEAITQISKKMENYIEQNTKKEIKELTIKLKRQVAVLQGAAVQKWLQAHRYSKPEVLILDADTQTNTQDLGGGTQTRNIGTQTGAWMTGKENILTQMPEERNLNSWRQYKNLKWSNKCYNRTETKIGNPLDTKDTTVKVVLVENDDIPMDKYIQRLYRNRFPELREIGEEYEVVKRITKVKYTNRVDTSCQKIVKISLKGTEEDLFEKLIRLKEDTADDEHVALHHIKKCNLETLRKMCEMIFYDTDTNLTIYTTSANVKEAEITKNKERSTCALIIEDKEDIKTLVTGIKTNLINTAASKSIKSLRTTKEGKLIIVTEQNKEAVKYIKEAVNKKFTNAKIRVSGVRETNLNETFHVRGMEITTTKNEIRTAIEGKVGDLNEDEIKISDFRPNRDNTLAATINISKEKASILAQHRYIRISMANCNIEKRLQVTKCSKCWSYEHHVRDCDGPNRSNLCYRCGEEGHQSGACVKDEFCPLCDTKGHKYGTGKCTAFKRALATIRRSSYAKNQRIHSSENEKTRINDYDNSTIHDSNQTDNTVKNTCDRTTDCDRTCNNPGTSDCDTSLSDLPVI